MRNFQIEVIRMPYGVSFKISSNGAIPPSPEEYLKLVDDLEKLKTDLIHEATGRRPEGASIPAISVNMHREPSDKNVN
jgi:hypothetical protein